MKKRFKSLLDQINRLNDIENKGQLAEEAITISENFSSWPFFLIPRNYCMAGLYSCVADVRRLGGLNVDLNSLNEAIEYYERAKMLVENEATELSAYIYVMLAESLCKRTHIFGFSNEDVEKEKQIVRAYALRAIKVAEYVKSGRLQLLAYDIGITVHLEYGGDHNKNDLDIAESLVRQYKELAGELSAQDEYALAEMRSAEIVSLRSALLPNTDKAEPVIQLEEAFRKISAEADTERWVGFGMQLIQSYQALRIGDPEENDRKIVSLYEELLEGPIGRLGLKPQIGLLEARALYFGVERRFGNDRENKELAFSLWLEGLTLANPNSFPDAHFNIRQNISVLKTSNFDYFKDIGSLEDEAFFFAEIGQPKLADTAHKLGICHQMIAEIYLCKHNDFIEGAIETSIHHFEEAVSIFRNIGGDYLQAALGNLATALSESQIGDLEANERRSIEIQIRSMEIIDRSNEPERWASNARNLALSYGALRTGNEADNIELALTNLEEALVLANGVRDPELRASICESISDVLEERPRGETQDNLEEALRRLYEARMLLNQNKQSLDDVNVTAKIHRIGSRLQNLKKQSEPEDEDTETISTQAYRQQFKDKLEVAISSGVRRRVISSLSAYSSAVERTAGGNLGGFQGEWFRQVKSDYELSIQLRKKILNLLPEKFAPIERSIHFEKVGQIYSILARFSSLDDVGVAHTSKLFVPENSNLSERSKDFYRDAVEYFQRSLQLKLQSGWERTKQGLLADIAHCYLCLRDWQNAAEYYRRANEEARKVYVSINDDAEGLKVHIEKLSHLMREGAYALAMSGQLEQSLAFLNENKARLLRAGIMLSNLERHSVFGSQVMSAIEERRSLEKALISSTDLFCRRPLIERIIELRADICGWIAEVQSGGLEEANIEKLAKNYLDNETVLVFPIFTSIGGVVIVIEHLERGINYSVMECAGEFALNEIFAKNKGGWTAACDSLARTDKAPNVDEQFFNAIVAATRQLQDVFVRTMTKSFAIKHPKKKMILVPDGRLGLLPVGLVGDHHGEPLNKTYELSIIPSLMLAEEFGVEATLRREPSLAVMFNYAASAHGDFFGIEAELVSSKFSSHSNFKIELNGAEQTQLEGMLKNASVWYFPSHGEFIHDDALNSTLTIGDDQKISLQNLFDLKLPYPPELVVLSSCETAQYNEGIHGEQLGWTTAFLQLGARGIVAPLWAVEEFPTLFLMEKLFELMKQEGETVPSALRKAQMWLRSVELYMLQEQVSEWQSRNRISKISSEKLFEGLRSMELSPEDIVFPNPNDWAAFVYYGDYRLSLDWKH